MKSIRKVFQSCLLLLLGGCATNQGLQTSSAPAVSHDELARAAQIPGTLALTTSPSGATLVIADRPPITTPSRVSDLRAGTYRIQIAFPGYEPETREVEIKAALVTNINVELKKIVGTVEILSSPNKLPFEIKASEGPAAALPPTTGITPAKVGNLTPGAYTVSVHQSGRTPYKQAINITPNQISTVTAQWPANEIWATRSADKVKIMWYITPGPYRGIELMRNTQERPAGRTRIAPVRIGVTSFEDTLPTGGRYWYWLKLTADSGETINVGPVEAVAK